MEHDPAALDDGGCTVREDWQNVVAPPQNETQQSNEKGRRNGRTLRCVYEESRSRQRDPRPRSSSSSSIPHLPPTQGIVGEVGVASTFPTRACVIDMGRRIACVAVECILWRMGTGHPPPLLYFHAYARGSCVASTIEPSVKTTVSVVGREWCAPCSIHPPHDTIDVI
jgi:hypothetical protein